MQKKTQRSRNSHVYLMTMELCNVVEINLALALAIALALVSLQSFYSIFQIGLIKSL